MQRRQSGELWFGKVHMVVIQHWQNTNEFPANLPELVEKTDESCPGSLSGIGNSWHFVSDLFYLAKDFTVSTNPAEL
jgi:hypothetical protein